MRLTIAFVWIALGSVTLLKLNQKLSEANQLERVQYQHLQYGNFKEFFRRMLNVSQVLASFDVTDYIDCAYECLSNARCFSFNFAILPDNITDRHICHLLASDKYNHSSSFIPNDKFHHYGISSPCESFPCQNGGICRPLYDKDSYVCDCTEGHNGTPCEKALLQCQGALGMANGSITDEQINASSVWNANHAAHQGRLHFQETLFKSGSWVPARGQFNQYQWLQIDLSDQDTKVTGVATQGRNYNNWTGGVHWQWVKKYKLQYSDDAVTFQYYRDTGQSEDKDCLCVVNKASSSIYRAIHNTEVFRRCSKITEFVANTDRDSVVYHGLNPPITARYIRFRPRAWNRYIAMRVELYGCKE